MTDEDTTYPDTEQVSAGEMEFTDEEDTGGQSSPAKDLGSACFIGAFAMAVAIMSLQLDVPDSVSTAPGLLPFITSVSLFFMALLLGFKALKAGGTQNFVKTFSAATATWFAGSEEQRSILLVAIVVAYIVLVGNISFDLRLPTPLFIFRLSSYEVISVITVTLIMKLFWRAPLTRCFLVSFFTIETLATIFRYGFGILMPESF
ncbi:MAG: hypothetical protein HOM55_00605 [Proteobacteria bacterium]|jgi:hypothetical protein|nr:hypothetical protein [Pseudomonadota bacterium]